MQKLINLGYGLEWNSCHEWGFMSIRFFLCPGALWRLLFENVHMKLSKRMEKRPAWPPVILNVREGNARQGEIESGPTDPKGLWEEIPWERPEQRILWVANGYWLPYADVGWIPTGVLHGPGEAQGLLAEQFDRLRKRRDWLCGTCELAIKRVLTRLSVVDSGVCANGVWFLCLRWTMESYDSIFHMLCPAFASKGL